MNLTIYIIVSIPGSRRALGICLNVARYSSSKYFVLDRLVLCHRMDRYRGGVHSQLFLRVCCNLYSYRDKIDSKESRTHAKHACNQPSCMSASSTIPSSVSKTSFSLWRINHELEPKLNEFHEPSSYDGRSSGTCDATNADASWWWGLHISIWNIV